MASFFISKPEEEKKKQVSLREKVKETEKFKPFVKLKKLLQTDQKKGQEILKALIQNKKIREQMGTYLVKNIAELKTFFKDAFMIPEFVELFIKIAPQVLDNEDITEEILKEKIKIYQETKDFSELEEIIIFHFFKEGKKALTEGDLINVKKNTIEQIGDQAKKAISMMLTNDNLPVLCKIFEENIGKEVKEGKPDEKGKQGIILVLGNALKFAENNPELQSQIQFLSTIKVSEAEIKTAAINVQKAIMEANKFNNKHLEKYKDVADLLLTTFLENKNNKISPKKQKTLNNEKDKENIIQGIIDVFSNLNIAPVPEMFLTNNSIRTDINQELINIVNNDIAENGTFNLKIVLEKLSRLAVEVATADITDREFYQVIIDKESFYDDRTGEGWLKDFARKKLAML